MDNPKDTSARVARSREGLMRVVERLRNETPIPRKGSPIATLLAEHADEIREALARGWSPGAIGRMLADEHVEFSPESIRLRIRAMFVAPAKRESSAVVAPNVAIRKRAASAIRSDAPTAPIAQSVTPTAPPAASSSAPRPATGFANTFRRP